MQGYMTTLHSSLPVNLMLIVVVG